MIKKQVRLLDNVSVGLAIVLYLLSSYLLGTINNKKDSSEEYPLIQEKEVGEYIVYEEALISGGKIIASKSGTKYYYPWCSGINRIKEENKVYFETEKEAEEKGLEISKTCN